MLVAVYYLQRHVHQFHLEGDVGLVTLADDPFVTIDVYDVVRCQVLYVDEREGGEAHEYKDVTHEGETVVVELMDHDSLLFFLGQEFPFLAIGADVVIDFVACKARTGQMGCGESCRCSVLSEQHLSTTYTAAK